MDDVDEFHPNDISYVYSGYAPLSVRLVQCALQKPGTTAAASASSITAGGLLATGASTASLFSSYGGGGGASINNGKRTNGTSMDLKQPGIANGKSVINGTAISNGWQGQDDVLKALPGKAFEIDQTVEYGPETNAALARAKSKFTGAWMIEWVRYLLFFLRQSMVSNIPKRL